MRSLYLFIHVARGPVPLISLNPLGAQHIFQRKLITAMDSDSKEQKRKVEKKGKRTEKKNTLDERTGQIIRMELFINTSWLKKYRFLGET
ncbi:hypothetical protein CEXT_426721 [Caerostris extrusa]|uniref:Uncharacterized protein n=1 Tax=Caerostris extrusa TaxID=172846 RepID=A0AAV4XVA1_CAEEX|nr:hypothetical protein CEXT_426721 [Caerostris extrusa]